MFGGIEHKINEYRQLFQSLQLKPAQSGIAIDMGAGNGMQSIPLAELGFRVFAVDFSSKLLKELEQSRQNLPIKTIEADILDFNQYVHLQPELVVCMGDTLPHLPSLEDLQKLFEQIHAQLEPGGQFVVSFRNLSNELKGPERFIPVRSDSDTIFSCFLEYFDEYVQVHDIIHKRENAHWRQKVSTYKKLRLSAENVISILGEAGFKIASSTTFNGMQLITAKKDA
jgi:2-polyprenyl-3-methyl-5-hydroxy-6-metoxy-1,4-benzoquinol methylase